MLDEADMLLDGSFERDTWKVMNKLKKAQMVCVGATMSSRGNEASKIKGKKSPSIQLNIFKSDFERIEGECHDRLPKLVNVRNYKLQENEKIDLLKVKRK